MGIILDASITLSWCFHDEQTPLTSKILEQLQTKTAFVPNIWPLEIGNILILATRHKRIHYADAIQFIELLNKLNIEVDNETTYKAFQEILALAHSEKLTTYDAAYIELAMRKGAPLASKDRELCKVAERLGIQIYS
ncbi:MAG: type II toxin-antitoxin system VapC family toxin [Gammaproteobacteria bacterium]|jgi:predicted nucleic acid-binding protein